MVESGVEYFVCAYYGEFGYNGYVDFKSVKSTSAGNNFYLHRPNIILSDVPEKRPNKFVFKTTQFNAIRKETGTRVDVKFEWDSEKIQEFVNQGFGQYNPEIGSICDVTDLGIPEPSSETPTKNSKITWVWSPIEFAKEYIVKLERVSKSENANDPDAWIVQEDFGIVNTTSEQKTEHEFRRSGYYRVSVTAKYKDIESEAWYSYCTFRFVVRSYVPTTKSPTSNRDITWNWGLFQMQKIM